MATFNIAVAPPGSFHTVILHFRVSFRPSACLTRSCHPTRLYNQETFRPSVGSCATYRLGRQPDVQLHNCHLVVQRDKLSIPTEYMQSFSNSEQFKFTSDGLNLSKLGRSCYLVLLTPLALSDAKRNTR